MLAFLATDLHRRVNAYVSGHVDVQDEDFDEQLWDRFSNNVAGYSCRLSATKLRIIYEHIRDARGDERTFSGRWHTAQKGRAKIPSEKTEQNTRGDYARERKRVKAIKNREIPLREQRAPPKDYGRFRLTPILNELAQTNGVNELKYPVRPAEIMCANLGLPTLPANNTFCY
jgi:hypothetical protein